MEDQDCCTYRCNQGRTCPKRVSKWQEESDYWLDDKGPAWWEIGLAAIVMVIVIAVIVISSWRLG